MKSKGKELLNAKYASYKSNKDLEHQNTNLKSNMLSIKKDMERIQSTHHFSIAAAVETAKLKERSLLRAEIKHMNVSSTAMFSASYLFFFLTRLICHKHIQERKRKLQASMAKHVQDNGALTFTVAALNARVSALGDSLKDQQMESNNA